METIIWTRRGSQTSEWLNAQVSISTADVDRVRPLTCFLNLKPHLCIFTNKTTGTAWLSPYTGKVLREQNSRRQRLHSHWWLPSDCRSLCGTQWVKAFKAFSLITRRSQLLKWSLYQRPVWIWVSLAVWLWTRCVWWQYLAPCGWQQWPYWPYVQNWTWWVNKRFCFECFFSL